MRLFIVLLTLTTLSVVSGVSVQELITNEWDAFKDEHKKSYGSPIEEKMRLNIFAENRNKIALHNQKYAMGLVPFKMGLNKYSDMLHHEFVDTVNGFNRTVPNHELRLQQEANSILFISPANVEFPQTVDWRTHGAVTPVKDQGHCGSCWSFATTGALEGQNFRKNGTLVSLSEQNLIDCSEKYGNSGCNGGLMDNAYQYIQENHGIDTESSYPYEGRDDTCRYKKDESGAVDKGFVDIPSGSEEQLMHAVATIGPVSVAIDASKESYQFYASGVYYEPDCDSESLDHAVLVVGYGTTEQGENYWLVKNSWGTTWGEQGYIKMARNKGNHCGIATSASYPLV